MHMLTSLLREGAVGALALPVVSRLTDTRRRPILAAMGELLLVPGERVWGLALTSGPRLNLVVRVSVHQLLELGESPSA